MDEILKTTEEAIKTTSKAVDLLTKEVSAFLFKIIGPAAEEFGYLLKDYVMYFRYKNLLRLRDKVDAIHRERRIEGKSIPIPPRYAIPLIQHASEEDNESLQEMWAGLISNLTDPEKRFNPKKIYIQIISSLEPLDAQVLNFFSNPEWKRFIEPGDNGVKLNILIDQLHENEKDLQLSLQNLARLGCTIDELPETWDDLGSSSFGLRVTDPRATFRLSPLGFQLIEACQTRNPKTGED